MGDMADFTLDAVFDEEERRMEYFAGRMTIEDAYEQGFVDELGGEVCCAGVVSRTCRCCGKGGLRWVKDGDRWRLYDGESIHVCPVNPLAR